MYYLVAHNTVTNTSHLVTLHNVCEMDLIDVMHWNQDRQ